MHNKKNILIFGGSGFIGSNFIKFIQHNTKVINFDKLTYASKLFNQHTKNTKNIKFIKQDICKSREIEKVLINYEPSIIINFAAESHVDKSIDDSFNFINTNINGVHSILCAIRKIYKDDGYKKLKFVQISTDEVFGSISKGKANELSVYNPSSPYSASKASADLLIKSFSKTYGINYKIIYSTNNYGPFQNYEKFVPKSILSILYNKKMTIYGDGTQQRDWVYVEDMCRGINKVINNYDINYKEFCISTEKNITNLEIIKKILNILYLKKLIPNKNIKNYVEYVRDRPGHDIRYALSNKRIKNNLNWQPKNDIEMGLEKTINWYLEQNKVLLSKFNVNKILKRKG